MAYARNLPQEILHMIGDQLLSSRDFSTLFQCAVSSKLMASIALPKLYCIYYEARLGDEDPEGLNFANQDLHIRKWAILWRSIILSCVGNTLFPYSKYIRFLDLRDLKSMLEDHDKIYKYFFHGALADFQKQTKYTWKGRSRTKLDLKLTVEVIADAIIPKLIFLERLSGEFTRTAFLRWTPYLSSLKRLELWSGDVLGNEQIQKAIHANCPKFESLEVFTWIGSDTDTQLGSFLGGLNKNSLKTLETFSRCDIAIETCLALNSHARSLKELRLNFDIEGISALSLLQGCTSVERLNLSFQDTVNVDNVPDNITEDLINWLNNCYQLQELTLTEFREIGPKVLTPLLLNSNIHLEKLAIDAKKEINLYSMKDNRDFHLALATHKSIKNLFLKGDGEATFRDDVEALIESVTQLSDLREMRLQGVSDGFSDTAIIQLLSSLHSLEEVYIGGYGVTDDVLDAVASLRNLRDITFIALTTFTVEGLLDLVSSLGPGNQGLLLTVDMADPNSLLNDEEQALVREALDAKVGGRFEYVPQRDPNIPEFEGESD